MVSRRKKDASLKFFPIKIEYNVLQCFIWRRQNLIHGSIYNSVVHVQFLVVVGIKTVAQISSMQKMPQFRKDLGISQLRPQKVQHVLKIHIDYNGARNVAKVATSRTITTIVRSTFTTT